MTHYCKRICMSGIAALLAGLSAISAVQADDIDVYRNFTPNPSKPPLVVLTLDLNLDPNAVLCANALTDAACGVVRSNLTFQVFIDDLLGGNINALRTAILALTFGTVDIIGRFQDNAQDTLDFLAGIFTTTVITTLLGKTVELDTTEVLTEGLGPVIKQLTDFRVAVMVSHSNIGTETDVDGVSYVCDFADLQAIPGQRADTTACSNGGYVFVGFVDLLNDPGDVNESNLIAKTRTLVSNALSEPAGGALAAGDSAHPFQGKELYYELVQYLTGGPIYNGHLGNFDFGNADGTTNSDTTDPTLSWDSSVEDGTDYRSALDEFGECDIVNVLNVMFTESAFDDDSDPDLLSIFPGADINGDNDISFPEVVSYADDSGFNFNGNIFSLRSNFLLIGNDADLLSEGGVQQEVSELESVLNLFGAGLSEAEYQTTALEVDASLLTPSVTIDQTASLGVQDSSFFSIFKPRDGNPRWHGNLKKLQLDYNADDDAFEFLDVNGDNGVSELGRIKDSALTFWTNPATLKIDGRATSQDGGIATLGGAGQRIPGFGTASGVGTVNTGSNTTTAGPRKLFYDNDGGTALTGLNANSSAVRDDLKSDSLGGVGNTEATALLHYMRGFEVGTTASPAANPAAQTRSWLHGAVFHSRPLAINYGARASGGYTANNPDIRIVYGATDGYLRMLRNTESGGSQSGVESWAVIPQKVMSQQKVLRDEDSLAALPYGVDGAPVAYIRNTTSASDPLGSIIESSDPDDRAWLYFGLRRSGAAYYGLNITNPDSPSLMWRISDSQPNFSEMGLAFSEPSIGTINVDTGSGAQEKVVLFIGGGYASKKDSEDGSGGNLGTDDAEGNALYIVDAETGALIWKAKNGVFNPLAMFTANDPIDDSNDNSYKHPLLVDSIPSQVSILDTDGDGNIDRFYVGDTGGRMWRGDIASNDRNDWTFTPIFSIGRHDDPSLSVSQDRRFFHRPDFVPTRSETGNYDVILSATGDQADPYNLTTENFLYAFRDADIVSGKAPADVITAEVQLALLAEDATHSAFVDITDQCLSAEGSCPDDSALATGWKLQLSSAGEKGLTTPLTLNGITFLTTYVPSDPAAAICIPQEGFSNIYAVALNNGRPTTIDQFLNDGDGNNRTRRALSRGLPGGSTPVTTSNIAAGAEVLNVPTKSQWRTFWRERLGESE